MNTTYIAPYRTLLQTIFDELKEHHLFKDMSVTVEGSPWHREANVLVHTEMVVSEFYKLTDAAKGEDWDRVDFLGGLVSIFHDVGKPKAKIEKESVERGKYFAFHGHEILSARLFEDFIMSKQHKALSAMLSVEDITHISTLIEYHMPWRIEGRAKLENIARTMLDFDIDVYTRTLLADQFGRIADEQDKKNQEAKEWVNMFTTLALNMQMDIAWYKQITDLPGIKTDLTLYVPIAASGSGKSTYYKQLVAEQGPVESYSLDSLRHEWYHATDYALAYGGAVDDPKFEQKARDRFTEVIKQHHKNVYVDNTNLSAKRRKFYLELAKANGYHTVAVMLPVALSTIIDRQQLRTDKTVPASAVKQHYFSLQMPLLGEFDEVRTFR